MPYNPYLHAHELGLKLSWADDVDPIEGARFEELSNTLVLRTGMNGIHERCILALHVVFAEVGALANSELIGANYYAARKIAAARLISREAYRHLMIHAENCVIEQGLTLRDQWGIVASYLGVTTGLLDAFAADNPPLVRDMGEVIAEPDVMTKPIAVVQTPTEPTPIQPYVDPSLFGRSQSWSRSIPIVSSQPTANHPTTEPVAVIPMTGDTGEILREDLAGIRELARERYLAENPEKEGVPRGMDISPTFG